MVDWTEEEAAAANSRGEIELATRPRAQSAHYDRSLGQVVVHLVNGTTFTFPPRLLQGLEDASDDEIAELEILGTGIGLHWEALDADFTVAGLMAGWFGSRRYMAERFGAAWNAVAAE